MYDLIYFKNSKIFSNFRLNVILNTLSHIPLHIPPIRIHDTECMVRQYMKGIIRNFLRIRFSMYG